MQKAQLENGYTKIANQIIEKLCTINLSSYETRVLMCIIRKTYGFNKKEDWIANSQIVKYTQIRKAHISRAIKKLKNRRIVTQTGKKIKVNTKTSSWLPNGVTIKKLPKQVTQLPNEVTPVTQTGNKKLPNEGDTKESIKETIQKKLIQKKRLPTEKDILLIDIKKIQEDYKVPESFVLSKWDDLMNYCHSSGKKYIDFNRALRKFVKEDAIKIRKDTNAKSKIRFINPS